MIYSYAIQFDDRLFFQSWKWNFLTCFPHPHNISLISIWNISTNQSLRQKKENWEFCETPENPLPFFPSWSMEGVWRDSRTLLSLDPRWRGVWGKGFGQVVLFVFVISIWVFLLTQDQVFQKKKRFNFKKKIFVFICLKKKKKISLS